MLNQTTILHIYGLFNGVYLATVVVLLYFSVSFLYYKRYKTALSLVLTSIATLILCCMSLYGQQIYAVHSANISPSITFVGKHLVPIGVCLLLYVKSNLIAKNSLKMFQSIKNNQIISYFVYFLLALLCFLSFIVDDIRNMELVHTSIIIGLLYSFLLIYKNMRYIPLSNVLLILLSCTICNSLFFLLFFNFFDVSSVTLLHLFSNIMHGLMIVIYGIFVIHYNELEYEKLYQFNTTKEYDIATDLNEAIANDNLYMVYQPKLALSTNKLVGLEALIRWKHPEKGLISPAEFIPVVEKSNSMINDLCAWTIKSVVRQAADFQRQNLFLPISINFSTKNINVETINYLKKCLADFNVKSSMINIEITETILLKMDFQRQDALQMLKDMNINLSMDDYGTGYSSIFYLEQLSLEEIKIDALFVKDLELRVDHKIIIESILTISRSLNIKVTAEGVETKSVCDILKDMGCDTIQGYFLTKPLTIPDLMYWIEQNKYLLSLTDVNINPKMDYTLNI